MDTSMLIVSICKVTPKGKYEKPQLLVNKFFLSDELLSQSVTAPKWSIDCANYFCQEYLSFIRFTQTGLQSERFENGSDLYAIAFIRHPNQKQFIMYLDPFRS